MITTLNQKIKDLKNIVSNLQTSIVTILNQIDGASPKPYTLTGAPETKGTYSPIGPYTGLGDVYGGPMIWNNLQLRNLPLGETAEGTPTEGYNKHSHSRFSGGALDINTLELVEYNVDWDVSTDYNKHLQDYWETQPPIATEQNSSGENVNKIGAVDFIFNSDSCKWGVNALEIDVKKCNLVLRDSNGDIETDDNGNPMSAPLYSTDPSKTCIVWDTHASCWRFFAVYAD